MLDTKHATSDQEAVKDGICGMCSSGCPTTIHVRQGRAIEINMGAGQRISAYSNPYSGSYYTIPQ